MPKVTNSKERHLKIEELLMKKAYLSSELLIAYNKLVDVEDQVSKRTIQTDLTYLQATYPGYIEKEGQRYRINKANHLLSLEDHSPKGKKLIKTLISYLYNIDNGQVFPLLRQLEKELGIKDSDFNTTVFQFDVNIYLENRNHLATLYTCINEKQVVSITYEEYDKSPEEYIIHPYFLKEYENRWYICGHNPKNKTTLYNLPLDRILTITPTNLMYDEYERQKSLDYYDEVIGVTVIASNPVEEITLTFKKPRGYYVITKPLHHSQKHIVHKETIEIRIKVRINPELIARLLSFGKDLVDIHPVTLATKVNNQKG